MNRRQFIRKSIATGVALAAAASLGSLHDPGNANAADSGTKAMKIFVITGSPRKNSNSGELASQFSKGASEKGHTVTRFDAGTSKVHPCIACNSCNMDGPCVFRDDFEQVREHLVPADLVAFASPMYYFGLSAQLKAVIDRFYALNGQIHVPKKAVLLMTYANSAKKQAMPIENHYDVLLDYLGWTDAGRVIAPGVWPAGAIRQTKYPELAYNLGKSL